MQLFALTEKVRNGNFLTRNFLTRKYQKITASIVYRSDKENVILD